MWFVDARRIEEYNLAFVVRMDAEDAVARRLGLIGNDRDFMLDDAVDECRLATFGRPTTATKPDLNDSIDIVIPPL